MLLTLNAGNTHTSLGLFQGTRLVKKHCIRTNRLAVARELSPLLQEILKKHRAARWEGAILASVVPEVNPVWKLAVQNVFDLPLLCWTPAMPMPIRNCYQPAGAVGVDRLVNAVAAVEQFGVPVIVVDFGTAITLDAVSRGQSYLGGAILPGLSIAAKALSRNTSLLPEVEVKLPRAAIGRNTHSGINSGIGLGTLFAVSGLIRKMKQEMQGRPAVLATGGMAKQLAPLCPLISEIRPHLTLEGLRSLWNYARQQGGKP